MVCPNCRETMELEVSENQQILHCKNCGGSYFEENGINRIRESFARKLSFDKRGNFVLGTEKLCPRDHAQLKEIEQNEAVPSTAHLFQCETCKGVFASPDDLLIFKHAQNAKVEYFKAWNMPMPAIKSVMVTVVVGVISLTVFTGYVTMQSGGASVTQASEIVKNIQISQSGRYVFVSFRTDIPVSSSIVFFDQTTNQKSLHVVNTSPANLHYVTLTDINTSNDIRYQIVVTTSKGKELRTDLKKLEFK